MAVAGRCGLGHDRVHTEHGLIIHDDDIEYCAWMRHVLVREASKLAETVLVRRAI